MAGELENCKLITSLYEEQDVLWRRPRLEVEERDSMLLFYAITLKLQFFMNLKLDSCIAIKKYCLLERGRQSMIEKKD